MQGLRVCPRVLLIYVDARRLVVSVNAEINVYFTDARIFHLISTSILLTNTFPIGDENFMAMYRFPVPDYLKKKRGKNLFLFLYYVFLFVNCTDLCILTF